MTLHAAIVEKKRRKHAQTKNTDDGFKEKYTAQEKSFQAIQSRIDSLEVEKADQEYRVRQAEVFISTLEDMETLTDANLFAERLNKVVVGGVLRFLLKDGNE